MRIRPAREPPISGFAATADRAVAFVLAARMKEFQAFSHVVMLQCILNPAFLGCLLALGPKGISCCLGLRGNQRLPLIRHIFAHLSGYRGLKKRLSQRS